MKTHKELKAAYKQQKFKIGVFQIRNTVNGKIFVGSSINLDAIWNRIRTELNFAGHRNIVLQTEWKTYGEKNFQFTILDQIEPKDQPESTYKQEIQELEKWYLQELQPFGDKGYNRSKI